MAAVAAGAAIVGAGISIYGAIKSANDEADQLEKRQALANSQADEMGYRENLNKVLRDEATVKNKLDFGAMAAASGHEGTGIGSQLEIQRQADIVNALSRHDVEYQQRQIREGGALQGDLAGQRREAGSWQAAGTGASLLGSFANRPSNYPNTGSTEQLPRFTGG